MSPQDREILKRVVAFLLSFAGLAESVSVRSRPVLCLVLWLLRPAEAVARNIVDGASQEFGVPTDLPACPAHVELRWGGESATEAVRLAVSFRMLAALLDNIVALAILRKQTVNHAGLTRFVFALSAGFASAMSHSLAQCDVAYADTS